MEEKTKRKVINMWFKHKKTKETKPIEAPSKVDFVVKIISTEDDSDGDLTVNYNVKSRFFAIDEIKSFNISGQYLLSNDNVLVKKVVEDRLSKASTDFYNKLIIQRKRKVLKQEILGIQYDETNLGIDKL